MGWLVAFWGSDSSCWLFLWWLLYLFFGFFWGLEFELFRGWRFLVGPWGFGQKACAWNRRWPIVCAKLPIWEDRYQKPENWCCSSWWTQIWALDSVFPLLAPNWPWRAFASYLNFDPHFLLCGAVSRSFGSRILTYQCGALLFAAHLYCRFRLRFLHSVSWQGPNSVWDLLDLLDYCISNGKLAFILSSIHCLFPYLLLYKVDIFKFLYYSLNSFFGQRVCWVVLKRFWHQRLHVSLSS